MELFDFCIGIFYLFLIVFIGLLYANRKIHDPATRNIFLTFLIVKLFATLLYCLMYKYYYTFGDTLNYYDASREFIAYIKKKPSALFDILFINEDKLYENHGDFIAVSKMQGMYYLESTIVIHKIVLYIGWIGLYLFYPVSLIFSVIAVIGCWKFSQVLISIYPEYRRYIYISILFIPSVLFWSTGINKESVLMGFIMYISAILLESTFFKRKIIFNILLSAALLVILLSVKSYVVLGFLPFFLFFLLTQLLRNTKTAVFRNFAKLTFFALVILALAIMVKSNMIEKITNEMIGGAFGLSEGQATYLSNNDSKYDLGITKDDVMDRNIIKFILPSINVSILRPYMWEVKKPIILFSALETFLVTLLIIFVFLKGKIYKTLHIILSDSLLLFIWGFTLVFSVFIGISSANFGTLVRYKIPFMPFFVLSLFIILYKLKKTKKTVND